MNEPISIPTAGHLGDPYLLVQTPKMVSQGKVPRPSLHRSPTSSGLSGRVAWVLFGEEGRAAAPAERRNLGMLDPRPGAAHLPWMLAAGTV